MPLMTPQAGCSNARRASMADDDVLMAWFVKKTVAARPLKGASLLAHVHCEGNCVVYMCLKFEIMRDWRVLYRAPAPNLRSSGVWPAWLRRLRGASYFWDAAALLLAATTERIRRHSSPPPSTAWRLPPPAPRAWSTPPLP